jgi:hypothetical protein
MGPAAVDDIVRATVRASPDPPRPVALGKLLRASYGSTVGKSMVGLALIGGVPITAIGLVSSRDSIGGFGIALFGIVFTIALLAVPAFPARRAARALRRDVRAVAEVVGVEVSPPGSRNTIDSIKHGFASGTWLVMHPMGSFETTFETDAAWVPELRVGSKVLLLVDPDRQRVDVQLGPVDHVTKPLAGSSPTG